jgi:hypothetical protein
MQEAGIVSLRPLRQFWLKLLVIPPNIKIYCVLVDCLGRNSYPLNCDLKAWSPPTFSDVIPSVGCKFLHLLQDVLVSHKAFSFHSLSSSHELYYLKRRVRHIVMVSVLVLTSLSFAVEVLTIGMVTSTFVPLSSAGMIFTTPPNASARSRMIFSP